MVESLILDTDIDTDCDDAGALAVLHALSDRGEVNLLGVICDIPYLHTAQAAMAINTYYGRPQIPVGLWSGEDLETSPRYRKYRDMLEKVKTIGWRRYNDTIGPNFANNHPAQPENGIVLYRRLLSEQPDHSVTIVAIGLLTALQSLLASSPDQYSPLTGFQLVQTKVSKLVTMGVGSFPQGKDVFNWDMDREATGAVLNNWPTSLAVSEWGDAVLTGARLADHTRPENPVRLAYEIQLGGPGRNRSSWDQLAVLYGVRGACDYFREVKGYQIQYDAQTGEHLWHPVAENDLSQIYLDRKASDETLAQIIESLMLHKE